MFDFLFTADMYVPDADETAELLSRALGIHLHKNWRQAFEGHPYVAHFARVNKSLAQAPTRIEPQCHLHQPNEGDPFFPEFLDGLERFQGVHRPMKTHSVVVATRDIGTVIERLMRRRLPFRLAQRTPDMPFDRLWLGVTPENPIYDPSVDGGLCIEVMPAQPMMIPEEAFAVPYPEPASPNPGDMIRVTARGFLVRDLNKTLALLSANLDWEPADVYDVRSEGYRVAKMGFTLQHSATLDIIEPTRWDSEAGLYLHNWGPGLYYIRIAANGLDAKAEDLRQRGTKFSWIESSESVGGGRLLRVDPACVQGQMFEFEEYQPLAAK